MPALSKLAALIRPPRLALCRRAGMSFTPRTIGLLGASSLAVANLRTPAFAFAWLFADVAKFIGSDLAIAVAVEAAENLRSLGEFGGIDHAVVICVERVEKIGHWSLHFPPRLLAAGSAFVLLRAFTRRAGRTLGSAGLPFGRLLGIVLCSERPRGERERHCGGKCLVRFHWIGGIWIAAGGRSPGFSREKV